MTKKRLEELMRVKDIAVLLGVGMPRAYQVTNEEDFPQPEITIGTIRLWEPEKVFRWAKSYPARQAARGYKPAKIA
jgi:hypothetical protein